MKLVREILQSEKGKEVWSSVSPIYNNDAYNLYIFEAMGAVLDDFTDFIESLYKEMFPQYSTWSLELKEELHGIKSISKSDVIRIQNLIEEMNRYQTVTPKQLENTINVHVKNKSATVQDLGGYYFMVRIPSDIDRDLQKITEVIERTKPAHLDYKLLTDIIVGVHIGATAQMGEILTIYPEMPTEVTTQLAVPVDAGTHYIEKIEIA